MDYKRYEGQQIGSDDPIELALLQVIDYNIPTQQTFESLQLLLKISKNILSNPNEQKFWTLKKENQKLKQNLYSLQNVEKVLGCLGFQDLKEAYQIYSVDDTQYEKIRKTSRSLEQYINSFVVLQEGDPKLNAIVQERKNKFEEEKKYKEQMLQQFEQNKLQVRQEHQEGQRKDQYDQIKARCGVNSIKNQSNSNRPVNNGSKTSINNNNNNNNNNNHK